MFKIVNCALVTLIPKTQNAKNMRDLRPISCCTTLYKIISKILINRLSKVISSVVDYSQFAFITGKVMQDNIIIAQELIKGYNRRQISPICNIQLEIQNSYDTLEWKSLRDIMREMNFPLKIHHLGNGLCQNCIL